MSIATSDPTIECHHPECDTLGRKWEFHHGQYCSNECETRHEGLTALKQFKYDHCRCFTCFRDLKEIQPAKDDIFFDERDYGWTLDDDGEPTMQYYSQEITREAAVGFEFLTPDATKGEKQRGENVITGTICDRCGATDHTDHDNTLATRSGIGRLATLLDANDDVVIDAETLHREYADHADLQLAVGHALE